MEAITDYTTSGVIQPTPHDSAEQQERWRQLDAVRAEWQRTGVRDTKRISELSAAIRREWQEQRKGRA